MQRKDFHRTSSVVFQNLWCGQLKVNCNRWVWRFHQTSLDNIWRHRGDRAQPGHLREREQWLSTFYKTLLVMTRRWLSWWANVKRTPCRRCQSRSLSACVSWTRSSAPSSPRFTGEQWQADTRDWILETVWWLVCRAFIGCWCFMYERWESGAFFTQTKPPTGETGNMEIYCYENWMWNKIINVWSLPSDGWMKSWHIVFDLSLLILSCIYFITRTFLGAYEQLDV